jgi:transcriptional regulator with XRE-family HTH domain
MEETGKKLQAARKRLGLSLEEVERSTRIRLHHLEALEKGDLEALPSNVQARGFLHNYAEFLGLDPEEITLRYAEALQAARTRPTATRRRDQNTTRPAIQVQRRPFGWLTSDVLVAGVITLAVLGVLIWGVGRIATALRTRSGPEQESSAFLIPTFTPEPSATSTPIALLTQAPEAVPLFEDVGTAEEPTATATLGFLVVPSNLVNIRLLIEQRTWLSVRVDGSEIFRGRVSPGEVLEYQATELVEITAGNGEGVRVFFQGTDQGLLGGLAQVVTRIWSLEGPITPTPTISPTPEATVTENE